MVPDARVPRLVWLACVAVLLTVALVAAPNPEGDALEYLQMTESFARHATPEVRAGDVQALARQDRRIGLGLNYDYSGYFDDPAGVWYACHFWAYSLLALPARLALPIVGVSGLRAFPVTNALLLLFALHRVLFGLPARPRVRIALFALLLASPVVFFLRWPHAEVMTVAVTTVALVELHARRHLRAALWASLGSLQSPPLWILLGLVWLAAVARDRRPRAVAAVSLAATIGGIAPAFYWLHFGTPSLIAREAANSSNLSLRRATELFFDLDIGLIAYLPLTVLLLMVACAFAVARARRAPMDAALVVTLGLMAWSTTATGNWNHGTIGPSRYAVWLLPVVLFLVARLGDDQDDPDACHRRGHRAAAFSLAMAVCVASQALIVGLKGGPFAKSDYLDHSWAARLVLRHSPALYNPSRPVFAARTTHQMKPGETPYVYRDGPCRKALVRPRPEDEAELQRVCGSVPDSVRRAFERPADPDAWFYVNY